MKLKQFDVNYFSLFLITILFLFTQTSLFSQEQNVESEVIKILNAKVKRSVIQFEVYTGQPLELKTSEGSVYWEYCYGVAKVLKYEFLNKKDQHKIGDKTFTEKIYLVSETHDLGLFSYFEKSWKPDQNGVWSDVLGLFSKTPLPPKYKRVCLQKLFYGDELVATHLVTFTDSDVKFEVIKNEK